MHHPDPPSRGTCCPCCWSSVVSRHPRLSASSQLTGLSWVRTASGSPHAVDDRSGAKKAWRARSRTVGTDDSSSRGSHLVSLGLCLTSQIPSLSPVVDRTYLMAVCFIKLLSVTLSSPISYLTMLFHFFLSSFCFFFESCFQTNRTFLRVKRVKTERHGSILNKKVRFTMKFNATHVI